MPFKRLALSFHSLAAASCLVLTPAFAASPEGLVLASPDGQVEVTAGVDEIGAAYYEVRLDGTSVLERSRLGVARDDADFTRGLKLLRVSETEAVEDQYEILTAKRRLNHYQANRRVLHLAHADGGRMDVVFQVSNDGVAFRYVFPETDETVRRIHKETTSFRFPQGTRAWLQPMAVAKSGWERTNPSYEEFYEMDIPAGTPSKLGAGWVFPALFRTGETWILASEADLGRTYCGSRLRTLSPEGEYTIGFPDPREHFQDGPVNPESALPWATPWRLLVVGSLKTVAESMLGVHLAAPARDDLDVTPQPGHASWSWVLMGDDNTKYDVQKRFIDYAADMGWRYCLIDALWDVQIGYDKIAELVSYARSKSVGILLWYNSAGDWNGAPQTPRDRMLTHESRMQEFEKLKAMGVAGLKIDFFGGDGQSVINYYHDILEDTARFDFMINFHGATLPRGWQRTYPHLMTVEAIRGLEFVTFGQENADREPTHATMPPFTRNVFDPMDFTPVVLDRINRIERRTTSAFELALAVLFTSGIQHFAETPDGMAKAPPEVREFLREVPPVWDDSKFLAGFPGKFVVMARRAGEDWYLAGINGEETEREVTLDAGELGLSGAGQLITDGGEGNLSFAIEEIHPSDTGQLRLTLYPSGGFVLKFPAN